MTAPQAVAPSRPADLRLARLHLRLGSLELARAELEALAGAGGLDPDALLDLAEIRWRTGDVAGAGVAAQAYIGEGGPSALALVIAAESSAAAGRPSEARRLAAQAIERADVPLDRLFAGIPRSGVWPIDPDERPEPVGELFAIPPTRPPMPARPGLDHGPAPDGADDVAPAAPHPPGEPAFPVATEPEGQASAGLWDEPAPLMAVTVAGPVRAPDPALELDAARSDLAAGRRDAAATRLAVVLRLAPSLSGQVLEALAVIPGSDDAMGAGLELVRGDAFRLVGREVEARRSYAAAAAALEPPDPSR